MRTHYLGADKGGEKAYRLLADAMAKSDPKHGQVIDIMEALKRSMERVPAKKKTATAAKKKRLS